METFTLDPRRWQIARIVGRNPLLRRSDRVEAFVVLVALVVAMLAVPLTGVVGAVVHGARERVYAQEAHERHRVVATVTDTLLQESGTAVVQARWPVPPGERTGTLELFTPVKAGQTVDIWIDRDGNSVLPPTPGWHAVTDAAGVVTVTLLFVAFAMTSALAVVYSRLNRMRDAAWEREIRSLVEDGGRTNWQ
ncbi:Rv1733c family protein [Mycobacterium sp. 050134]|uniref:Rv1733c family protein n=1 Tax=Mycobacterium sp. 050134 TaxID=3096111 RepID=UPI002ED994E1